MDDVGMSDEPSRKQLNGSLRPEAPPRERIGDTNPDTPVSVTVYLRGAEAKPGRMARKEMSLLTGRARQT